MNFTRISGAQLGLGISKAHKINVGVDYKIFGV